MNKLLTYLFLLSTYCLAQTQIVGPLNSSADSFLLFNGRLHIVWPAFVTADHHSIGAGMRDVDIANGVLDITLWPTQGAGPATTYTVSYIVPGLPVSTEKWGVPISASPVSIASLKSVTYASGAGFVILVGNVDARALSDGCLNVAAGAIGSTGVACGSGGGGGSGLTSLNALTGGTQTFSTSTVGTDFTILSSGTSHTFRLPTASSSNRGALSSADWTLFNSKQSALGFTPESAISAGTTAQYYRGDKSFQPLSAAVVAAMSGLYEPPIAGGSTAQYLRGDKSLATFATDAVAAMSGLYEVPLTFTAPLTRTTNTITCGTATGSVAGCISAADWTTFNNKLSANQSITVSGDASGLGATAITLSITKVNGVAFSGLATGILKNTTGTGAPSIAVAGTDYENPLTFNSPLGRSINAVSCATCGVIGTGLNQFASTSSLQFAGVISDETGSGAVVFGTTPTIATPVINGLPTGTGIASAATVSTLAARDSSGNLTANSTIDSYTTTASAAGTTTLTVGSTKLQYFTGVTTQTLVLPVTSTLVLGQSYEVINNSTGIVTVQSSGANSILAMAANSRAEFSVILTSGTTAASWSLKYWPSITCTNQVVTAVLGNGAPTCTTVTPSYTSGFAASATTDTTNASNINSGTLPHARIPTVDLTREAGFILGADGGTTLTNSTAQASMFVNRISALHVTEIYCDCDAGSPVINLKKNGAGSNLLSSSLTCSTSGVTSTSFNAGEDAYANAARMDFTLVTASTAARVTVYVKYTVD